MSVAQHDVFGFIGAVLIVVAYFSNVRGLMLSEGWLYPLLNLVGAALILYSLWWDWNFSAAVIEGFWIAISVYGLIKFFRTRYARPSE